MSTKAAKKTYNTIGVRFLYGHSLDKIYTYKVRKGVKLHLGQLLVSPPSPDGKRGLCAVVEIHKQPQDTVFEIHKQPQATVFGISYKFIEEKVAGI